VKDHSLQEKGIKKGRTALLLSVCLILSLVSLPAVSEASWLIDPEAFHASVHGRTSCGDCHGETLQKPIHPDPVNITKKRSDFFNPEHCFACHDDVAEKLSSNLHGSRQIEDSEKFRSCISCHDPHSQLPIQVESGRFDPSIPRHRQCGACHEEKNVLPALSGEDQSCMSCHSAAALEDPERLQGICLHCHGLGEGRVETLNSPKLPLIRLEEYERTTHAGIGCTVCHPESIHFEHDRQKVGDCRHCHRPHSEKIIHDAHIGVSCGACHLKGVAPAKHPQTGMVFWVRDQKAGEISSIHEMSLEKLGEESCRRCHAAGNKVGAAAMVLPPKSLLCMPCHTATFSAGDTTTILGMTIFFAGIVLFLAPAMTGSQGKSGTGPFVKLLLLIGEGIKVLFSRKIFHVLKLLFLDVLLQRRLYSRSKERWVIHSLIFYPFVFRFLWGLAALLFSTQRLESGWVWEMLNKNHPLTGFFFEVTGIMLIIGVALAYKRGAGKNTSRIPGVPGQDRIALGLIAGIAVIGFVLEGMRIAMTGWPEGSGYAFLGYGISRLLAGWSSTITGVYGYVWYLHAVLTGGFIAYLPFSRLLHMIIAPWALASRTEE
jgi:nitrate reductase gamma subunit